MTPTLMTCPRCDGDGEEPGAPFNPDDGLALCLECDGRGEVPSPNMGQARQNPNDMGKAVNARPRTWGRPAHRIAVVAVREGNVSRAPVPATVTTVRGMWNAVGRFRRRLRGAECAVAWITADTARAFDLDPAETGPYRIVTPEMIARAVA